MSILDLPESDLTTSFEVSCFGAKGERDGGTIEMPSVFLDLRVPHLVALRLLSWTFGLCRAVLCMFT